MAISESIHTPTHPTSLNRPHHHLHCPVDHPSGNQGRCDPAQRHKDGAHVKGRPQWGRRHCGVVLVWALGTHYMHTLKPPIGGTAMYVPCMNSSHNAIQRANGGHKRYMQPPRSPSLGSDPPPPPRWRWNYGTTQCGPPPLSGYWVCPEGRHTAGQPTMGCTPQRRSLRHPKWTPQCAAEWTSSAKFEV